MNEKILACWLASVVFRLDRGNERNICRASPARATFKLSTVQPYKRQIVQTPNFPNAKSSSRPYSLKCSFRPNALLSKHLIAQKPNRHNVQTSNRPTDNSFQRLIVPTKNRPNTQSLRTPNSTNQYSKRPIIKTDIRIAHLPKFPTVKMPNNTDQSTKHPKVQASFPNAQLSKRPIRKNAQSSKRPIVKTPNRQNA